MTDQNPTQRRVGDEWRGFREVDQAIAENRLTSYTWKKTWSDRWGRAMMILVFLLLAAYLGFVVVYDLVL